MFRADQFFWGLFGDKNSIPKMGIIALLFYKRQNSFEI